MRFVVVGGGIAAVTCAETLATITETNEILLVSGSPLLKGVRNLKKISKTLEDFDVVESDAKTFVRPNLQIILAVVESVDVEKRILSCSNGELISYDKLCLATGARPKPFYRNPFVYSIRDSDSIERLRQSLSSARRILLVGNGGVALELVSAVDWCPVVWVVKHAHIGNKFFDPDSARFFLPSLLTHTINPPPPSCSDGTDSADAPCPISLSPASTAVPPHTDDSAPNHQPLTPTHDAELFQFASAVGPHSVLHLAPHALHALNGPPRQVRVEYCTRVSELRMQATPSPYFPTPPSIPQTAPRSTSASLPPPHAPSPPASLAHADAFRAAASTDGQVGACQEWWNSDDAARWPLAVRLSNGRVYGCDLIVNATGVVPNTDFVPPQVARGREGGVLVNACMESCVRHVYAAGDCCTTAFSHSPHWFQMRLWSQARLMAEHCARCMAGSADDISSGLAFEIFAHVTHVLGKKVVLLGLYNAQGLQGDFSKLVRERPGEEYVKVILHRGRVFGATLIGDTGLEETFENLILSGVDVSHLGERLLDPDFDLEDYFD